jgi:transformation/transcription domain-associated protein
MNGPGEVSRSATMETSKKTESWDILCQRLQASSNLFEIQSIWQDIMIRFEAMRVGTDGFSTRVVTLLSIATSIVTTKTKPTSDNTSIEHQVRYVLLEWIHKLVQIYANALQSHPSADPISTLRPHAMNMISVAMGVLIHDYELNAVVASRIVFDLYKTYRNTLSTDYVQVYLDFVISLYRNLPGAVARNFQSSMLVLPDDTPILHTPLIATKPNDPMDVDPQATDASTGNDPMDVDPNANDAAKQPSEDPGSHKVAMEVSTPQEGSKSSVALSPLSTPKRKIIFKSNASFQVLTECPLIVMLLFQLYPQFMKINIPILIQGMMESLGIRVPAWVPPPTTPPPEYFSRARELVAAQAKTVSFLTYLLRSFANELKPYEERLAANVIYLMKTCPRESVSTRKELLVATRHLLNSEFRNGFFRHMDPMLDERLFLGSTSLSHRPDPKVIRPLAYTTLSDFVQQARTLLTMPQMSRVVGSFSRVLHDASVQLPLATQYTAVRTLLSLIDLIYQNKDPDPQLGRDMLVRLLYTLVDKLQALNDAYPDVERAEQLRDQEEDCATDRLRVKVSPRPPLVGFEPAPTDTVREVQSLIRTIIVGQKNIIFYICSYRGQRLERAAKESGTSPSSTRESLFLPPPGSNEEVASALLKVSHTEAALLDQYIQVALSSMRRLSTGSTTVESSSSNRLVLGEKPVSELHRDALTYFAATFTAMDGYTLRRSLGRRIERLVDTIVEDPLTMIVPRHLLGSNATTSYEFCSILLDFLMEHLDLLYYRQRPELIFFDEATNHDLTESQHLTERIHAVSQRPVDSMKRHTHRSNTLLQLFERVFKSLTVYPENEAVIRKHLRQIVVVCVRTSMEHTSQWPENYAVLLRYVFRSISAGKFEESYRELLPLIPTVLNGLCRVVCCAEDSVLRNTAIELCLTIPARLSSLLPHMNLLLRIIIPALDSNVNELVNLGYVFCQFSPILVFLWNSLM